MVNITRREKHVLSVFVLTFLIIVLLGIDQQTLNDNEYIWLLFYVVPLGVYIITDPERRKQTL